MKVLDEGGEQKMKMKVLHKMMVFITVGSLFYSSRLCLSQCCRFFPVTVQPASSCSTAKKQSRSRLPLSAKKTNNVLKGREEASGSNEQVLSMANDPSNIVKSDISDGDLTMVPYVKEEKCSSVCTLSDSDVVDIASAIVRCSCEEEILDSGATQNMDSRVMDKEDALVNTQSNSTELIPHEGDNFFKTTSYTIVDIRATTFKDTTHKLKDIEQQILRKRTDPRQFETVQTGFGTIPRSDQWIQPRKAECSRARLEEEEAKCAAK